MSEPARNYLTAEEFLAQVEAQRQKRLQEPRKAARPFVPGPVDRTYQLDWSRRYSSPRAQLIIPEDMV